MFVFHYIVDSFVFFFSQPHVLQHTCLQGTCPHCAAPCPHHDTCPQCTCPVVDLCTDAHKVCTSLKPCQEMGSHHRRAKTPKTVGRVNRHPRRLCLGVERRETSSYWQAPLTGAPQPLMDICAGSGLSPPGWWEATQRLAAPSEGAGPPTCGATKTG